MIGVVSRFPPPIGGVSVYASRRVSQLINDNVPVKKIDINNKRTLLLELFFKREVSVYEVNSLNFVILFLFVLSFRIGVAKFIDHNASRHFENKAVIKWLVNAILRKSAGVYVVNSTLLNNYTDEVNTSVISPFLPPELSNFKSILSTYPEAAIPFFNRSNVLVNSAWKYVAHGCGDLYGLETSIDIALEIKEVNLVLAIGSYVEKEFPSIVIEKMNNLNSQGRLLLISGQRELWPVFKFAPTFLRLTPTDGDSVSVREALFFGCKVIASDCINRPKGCFLYKFGSKSSLRAIIIENIK